MTADRRHPRTWLVGALLACVLAAGCGPTPAPTSPSTAPPSNPAIASPSAQATGPAVTTDANAAAAIVDLLGSMSARVTAADRAAYLALVDQSDPTFALEHGRWADEWSSAHPVAQYSLGVSGLAVEGNAATGRLTVTWTLREDPQQRAATFDARFTRSSAGWRYAGERWVETQAPHFRILAAPGLEAVVPSIAADLPGIYDGATAALDYEPVAPLVIKLYADASALVANTLLSLPEIRGWNEPGEALKLRYAPNDPLAPTIAHEFTHFSMFDRAGTKRTRMPWWLDEGLATFVAEPFEGANHRDRLGQVIAWQAAGELAPWDAMTVFEEAPVALWTYVYPQGYAMVRYVTERFGATKRNAWLAAMATEMTIDQATPAVLGSTFGQLDADFRAWLPTQAASSGP